MYELRTHLSEHFRIKEPLGYDIEVIKKTCDISQVEIVVSLKETSFKDELSNYQVIGKGVSMAHKDEAIKSLDDE